MRIIFILTLMFTSTICRADIKLKIYYEKVSDGYEIYADNQEVCPLSVKIDFELVNLNISEGNNRVYVINANTKRQLLTRLTTVNAKSAYQFTFKYWTNYGNHLLNEYDKNYIYDLPFLSPDSYLVSQGYNGAFSHKNENSIDFTMPEGTKIVAVRDGIVVKVIDENNKGCPQEECKKYNNEVLIYHPDGTFAVYLHIAIFLQKLNERKTLKTKFRVGNGDRVEYLVEKNTYARNYQ